MTRLDLYGEWLKIEESRDMKTSESRKEMLVVWTSVGAKEDAGINKHDFFFLLAVSFSVWFQSFTR